MPNLDFFPPSASPSERDLFPCLSSVCNPIVNLPSCSETQACGLSMCQAVNVLVIQDGLAGDLYIIPQSSVSKRLNFSLLPASLLIPRKCFYFHCPTKHGRTSLHLLNTWLYARRKTICTWKTICNRPSVDSCYNTMKMQSK